MLASHACPICWGGIPAHDWTGTVDHVCEKCGAFVRVVEQYDAEGRSTFSVELVEGASALRVGDVVRYIGEPIPSIGLATGALGTVVTFDHAAPGGMGLDDDGEPAYRDAEESHAIVRYEGVAIGLGTSAQQEGRSWERARPGLTAVARPRAVVAAFRRDPEKSLEDARDVLAEQRAARAS